MAAIEPNSEQREWAELISLNWWKPASQRIEIIAQALAAREASQMRERLEALEAKWRGPQSISNQSRIEQMKDCAAQLEALAATLVDETEPSAEDWQVAKKYEDGLVGMSFAWGQMRVRNAERRRIREALVGKP